MGKVDMSSLQKSQEEWSDPEREAVLNDVSCSDWRLSIFESYKGGDVIGMQRDIAPTAQRNIIEIANESRDERIKLEANKLLLEQAGYGGVKRIEHTLQYEAMTEAQLMSLVKSKLGRLQRAKPDLDFSKLLPADIVEGEFEDDSLSGSSPEETEELEYDHEE